MALDGTRIDQGTAHRQPSHVRTLPPRGAPGAEPADHEPADRDAPDAGDASGAGPDTAGPRRADGPGGRDPGGPGSGHSAPSSATGRLHAGWRHVFAIGLVCFAVWLVLDAPTLLKSAEGSPLGARRTVAIDILRPLAALSRDLGLSHIVGATDRTLGRDGSGVISVVGPPPGRAQGHPAPLRPVESHTVVTAPDGLPPLPTPTTAAPLSLLSVGDSIGVDLGGALVNDLAQTGVVRAALDARVDTGLSRPDYFDWPAELHADLVRYQPRAVVVFLGANDPQNFIADGTALTFGTPQWSAAYAQRVGAFMAQSTQAGARVLWVGLPPMADPALNAEVQVLNGIYAAQAAQHPGVSYLSSWPVLSGPGGRFATYLPDSSGNEVAVRTPDGTHLTPAGADRLAAAVIGAMNHDWGLDLNP